MADKEEKGGFNTNFIKAKTKNVFEDRFLHKQLKLLDREHHKRVSTINNEILEEKRTIYRLKKEAEENKLVEIDEEMEQTTRSHYGLHKSGSFYRDSSFSNNDDKMHVAGRKMSSVPEMQPSLSFWSQDASTKLPVMTNFYGFKFSWQRSITELKLLGQQTYAGNKRESQSADQALSTRLATQTARTRNLHTSQGAVTTRGTDDERHKGIKEVKPSPTRSKISMNGMKTGQVTKLYDITNKLDNGMAAPEEINLNLKPKTIDPASSVESLPHVIDHKLQKDRISGQPMDSRRARRKLAVLSFKTREEATRCYKDMLQSKNNVSKKPPALPASATITELERSYSNIPIIKSEVTRLKEEANEGVNVSNKYTKSAYGLHMQNDISKKAFSNTSLPVPFRKNHSTFLKHYGTPIVEDKTQPPFNTPETLQFATPGPNCLPVDI